MKKLILIVFFFPIFSFSQGFKWNWAVMNHTCPQELSSNYQIVDGDDGPKYMEIDSMGNVYVLGFIRNFNNNATFGTNSNQIFTYNGTNLELPQLASNIVYLQKIDSTGNIHWVKNFQTSNTWEGNFCKLIVDPISQNCFVMYDLNDVFYINDEMYTSGQLRDIFVFNTNGNLEYHIEDNYLDVINNGNSVLFCKTNLASGTDYYRYQNGNVNFVSTILGGLVLFYDPFKKQYLSRVGSNLRFYDSDLQLVDTRFIPDGSQILSNTEIKSIDRLGRVIFGRSNGLLGFNENQEKILQIGFTNLNIPYHLSVDVQNNPWIFFHGYTSQFRVSYYPSTTFYDVYPFVSPSTISNYALKIDVENDTLTGEYFAASNIDYSIGGKGFKINNKNEFFLAGGFRYEAEFSNTLLEYTCPGSLMPARKHYIAKAVVGEDTSRFTLNTIHDELNLSIYPNPTQSSLTIECEENVNQLHVFDLTGKIVLFLANPSSNVFDVSTIMNGHYFIEISTDSKKVIRRFVKE